MSRPGTGTGRCCTCGWGWGKTGMGPALGCGVKCSWCARTHCKYTPLPQASPRRCAHPEHQRGGAAQSDPGNATAAARGEEEARGQHLLQVCAAEGSGAVRPCGCDVYKMCLCFHIPYVHATCVCGRCKLIANIASTCVVWFGVHRRPAFFTPTAWTQVDP